jgi:hypothetical protein
MPCLLILVVLCAPRAAIFLIWLLTNWFSQSFQTVFWPIIGFLFMPFTTLAYMAAMLNNHHHVDGWWIVLIILAVLSDLTSSKETARKNR